jgi:predicted enzyme related to lactoylglutathione lyase
MKAESLSAVVFFSPEPEPLAEFYRRQLGIDFKPGDHGSTGAHFETWFNGTHLAVLTGETRGVSPTFRVHGLDAFVVALEKAGRARTRPILELGQGKRVVSFRDPDGNLFNLIDLGV